MNLPFLTRARLVPAVAILLIALVLFALPEIGVPPDADTLYSSCAALASSNPEKALALAHRWRDDKPDSPTARHCEALALYATHDYDHAAASFAALAKETAIPNQPLSTRLLLQAAEAYRLAGQHAAATTAAAAVLTADPANPEAKKLISEGPPQATKTPK